jgi:hypothetical protein
VKHRSMASDHSFRATSRLFGVIFGVGMALGAVNFSVSADPLTRLAMLATLSPKGARELSKVSSGGKPWNEDTIRFSDPATVRLPSWEQSRNSSSWLS